MKNVTVKTVSTKSELRDFVRLPRRIYAHYPCYVPDMESDVRDTFSPQKNAELESSDIQPFIAYADGEPAGRIVGIVNHRANEQWHTRNVRFGFLEFTDDHEVSRALLEAVEEWGRRQGMTRIQGPMGFSDLDKEGMLVEDFDLNGSMTALYNPPYYPVHLERLGYEKEVDWLQARINIPREVPEKYARVARLAREMFGLHTRELTKKEIYSGYGQKIFQLINLAYAPIFGYAELSERQINFYLNRYVPLLDTRMLSVVEDEKGGLVAAAITMRSLALALQKSQGRLFPFGWFHLLRALTCQREDKAEMLLVAVHPDYQGLGVNALFFENLIPVYNRLGIRWAETGPQLESNVRELSQWKPLNPGFVKRRRCYTKDLYHTDNKDIQWKKE